jgi:flagellar basal body rod protein FlgG
MAGSYYIALSGMRARLDALDRVASDIANVSTAGYKGQRGTTMQADRPQFGQTLQAAIDVADGPARLDLSGGAIAPTGRDLDLAIDGPGLFAVNTPGGLRYTRDGQFVRRADGVLTNSAGDAVESVAGGPITLPSGAVQIDEDGSVRVGASVVGRLKVVEFDAPQALVKDNAHLFRADSQAPKAATASAVRTGSLEQSNVSVVERLTQLTSVTRGFEALQRALSTMVNDIDGRAIAELGRRS